METTTKRLRMTVPYGKKAFAKQAGALWDNKTNEWYVPEGTPRKPLENWLARNPQGKLE